ncbi:hypothetical protein ECANGB1_2713 [Enterospora canceri]|uniref:Uncharacterized protein n=1 Tax=Enterospora canceri TaxID=1081671 RepID=A0A1Y1S5M4_9MICR|nr:hypothetical protein ECANGB1_2727 [Enterospora canceri]ORD93703.1 hypothetical protein ECANGB1_2713 [Enterospora canceri]
MYHLVLLICCHLYWSLLDNFYHVPCCIQKYCSLC